MPFTDRVCFITGASSGIGAATAMLFAERGARVAGFSRGADDLRAMMDRVTAASGAETLALAGDVSQPDDVRDAIEQTVQRWGRLDHVFANAGINGVWAPLDELQPEEWEETLAVNLTGTFLTARYAVPHLKRQGGSITVTSSVNGTRMFSNTGASAYASSKAAQVAFAKMIALELAEWKIRVNVICPGAIETDIGESTEKRDLAEVAIPVEFPEGNIPLTHGRPGSPRQVAELVLFLASDAASLITGTEVWIDGAESLLQG